MSASRAATRWLLCLSLTLAPVVSLAEAPPASAVMALETAAPCPSRCPSPMQVAPGVETLGELETLALLQDASGATRFYDARSPAAVLEASLPGARPLPAFVAAAAAADPRLADWYARLGVVSAAAAPWPWWQRLLVVWGLRPPPERTADWDYREAPLLVIWDAGASGGEAAAAIRQLRELGYPAERLKYYRGGIEDWRRAGLALVAGGGDRLAHRAP